jgi:hypothetical protein
MLGYYTHDPFMGWRPQNIAASWQMSRITTSYTSRAVFPPWANMHSCRDRVRSDTTCNTLTQIRSMPIPPVGRAHVVHSTPLTCSCSLRVKGLSQRCYVWITRVFMLVKLSLNSPCRTNPTTQLNLGHMGLHYLAGVFHSPRLHGLVGSLGYHL